ncbi:MAG: hypothetical protein OQK46_02965 [Gammaproteobacteria bacterium]|nr:hypothetical protein [Gammaproteobacteria bacterium]
MSNGLASSLTNRQLKCEVCDCLINYPDTLLIKDTNYTVCRAFDCQRVMNKKRVMTPFMFKSHLDFNRTLIRKNREKSIATKQHIEQVTAREKQENELHLKNTLITNSHISENDIYLLTIPSGDSSSSACEKQRIDDYIKHLKSIIIEAENYDNASEVAYDEHHDAYRKRCAVENSFIEKPQLKKISDNLCTMCKGGCCASGKEHAYLSVFSMRRYMDANPDLTGHDILNIYTSHIQSESIIDSCINQTSSGCALPRELRSDICNGYYCDPLKQYHKNMLNIDAPKVILAIQRSYTYWDRFKLNVCNDVIDVALVDEHEINFTTNLSKRTK